MSKIKREFGHLTRSTQYGLSAIAMEIKLGRKRKGWTQKELASRAGCSRLTIIAIENGKATVSIGHVLEAAHMVGLNVFGSDDKALTRLRHALEMNAIFPSRMATQTQKIDDDF